MKFTFKHIMLAAMLISTFCFVDHDCQFQDISHSALEIYKDNIRDEEEAIKTQLKQKKIFDQVDISEKTLFEINEILESRNKSVYSPEPHFLAYIESTVNKACDKVAEGLKNQTNLMTEHSKAEFKDKCRNSNGNIKNSFIKIVQSEKRLLDPNYETTSLMCNQTEVLTVSEVEKNKELFKNLKPPEKKAVEKPQPKSFPYKQTHLRHNPCNSLKRQHTSRTRRKRKESKHAQACSQARKQRR